MEFRNIGELRSLVLKVVNMMALTATASFNTRKIIQDSLCMHDFSAIVKIPNRLNIKYMLTSKCSYAEAFDTLIESIIQNGMKAKKSIIFCSSYNDAVSVLEYIASKLGEHDLEGNTVVCDIFTASSHIDDKERILREFTERNSYLCIIVATSAFGMGIDAPDIYHVLHWGPPKTIEEYVQESGRGGRDGKHAIATMFYARCDIGGAHPPSPLVISYCNNKTTCRRELLMAVFDVTACNKPSPIHLCCDICWSTCSCLDCLDLKALESYEESRVDIEQSNVPSVLVTAEKKYEIKEALLKYRSSLQANHQIPLLFGLQLASGITDVTINKIATNYTIEDIMAIGIDSFHAQSIYSIVLNIMNK